MSLVVATMTTIDVRRGRRRLRQSPRDVAARMLRSEPLGTLEIARRAHGDERAVAAAPARASCRSARSRRSRRSCVVPTSAPIFGHDAAQRVDVASWRARSRLAGRFCQSVPHRAEQPAGDAVALGRREEDAPARAPFSSGAPPSLLLLERPLVERLARPAPARPRAPRRAGACSARPARSRSRRSARPRSSSASVSVEAHDGRLRGGVGADPRQRVGRAAAGEVDDLAVAAARRSSGHARSRHMSTVPNRLISIASHPLVPVDVLDRAHRAVDAGVVDEDVEVAEEPPACADRRHVAASSGSATSARLRRRPARPAAPTAPAPPALSRALESSRAHEEHARPPPRRRRAAMA